MKILLAGDWHSDLHEEVACRALRELGHEVIPFKWCEYFGRPAGGRGNVGSLVRRVQNKLLMGPLMNRLNKDLLRMAVNTRPDVLFVYRGTHVTAATLRAIRRMLPRCVQVGYNNDNPFAPGHSPFLWRIFLRAVPAYDLMLAYRHADMPLYAALGVPHVALMRSWFVPWRNRPVTLSPLERQRYQTDVVFIGHYEDDGRLACLEALARAGVRLRLFGHGEEWNAVLRSSPLLRPLAPVHAVWGDDYNRALCGARIALCFFSKLNQDTYTRRCFEIPAAGTLLLSEYSEDLASLYKEGVEADFFRDAQELVAKVNAYLCDEARRQAVAQAGLARVRRDGHDVESRMQHMLEEVRSHQLAHTR